MKAAVSVVGSFNMDLTTYMARLPGPGETVMARKFVTGPGGKGSNQAVGAARLGAMVTFIGCVGQDSFGDAALATWEAEGINTEFVRRDADEATGVAPIFVDDSGENCIAVASGANLKLSPADVDAAGDSIARSDILLAQLEIDLAVVQQALQLARDAGLQTILNPAPAQALSDDILSLVDYLTPNESELEILYGEMPENLHSAVRFPGQTLVMTAGGRGAFWATQTDSGHVPGYEVEVVDTTGAGDAFNAGLAVALAEGRALPEAIAFANATAALAVTTPGTTASMPQRAAVDALMQQGA